MEFIGAILLAHLVGDYLLQTEYMANAKLKSWLWASLHGFVYTLPFIFITQSLPARLVIGGTHAIIDRYRLARYVVWFRNQITPKGQRYALTATGTSGNTPPFIAVWLLFIADNILHLLINLLAVMYLYGARCIKLQNGRLM